MNPDENIDIQSNPQEYLDQISTKKPSRFKYLDKKIVVLVSAIVLLIIVAVIWFVISSSPKTSSTSQILSARLQNMSTLIDYDNSKITDSISKKAIAETKIVFASCNYQLSQNLALTVSPEAISEELIDDKLALLDNASSSNNFTKEYLLALNDQINQIIISLMEIKTTSSNLVIERAVLDLTELSNRLSSY